MLSFTQFLTEAKVPSFNSYAKETFSILSKLPNFSVRDKLSLGGVAGKESAHFKIFKELGSTTGYTKLSKDEQRDVYNKFSTEYEKIKKSILLVLGCAPAIVNAKHHVDWQGTSQGWKEIQVISFTDTKNAYNVQLTATLLQEFSTTYAMFEVELVGAEIKSQTTFVDYPEFVPGAILHSSWGYSMTINSYYEIVKRTNKTVYVVELGNKKVDGDGWTGHEVPNTKQRGKTVLSGRIKPNKSVTIDGKYCRIWDGIGNYYNSLD
jgi:hypothetical protein